MMNDRKPEKRVVPVKKIGKRLLAAALCTTVAFQGIPVTALAQDAQTAESKAAEGLMTLILIVSWQTGVFPAAGQKPRVLIRRRSTTGEMHCILTAANI